MAKAPEWILNPDRFSAIVQNFTKTFSNIYVQLYRIIKSVWIALNFTGLASSAGLGIFAMSAHVAGRQAGPAVVLSVLVSGIAALLSGLCHIELATRLPRCGTGYVYCYVTLGELLAFVIGWSLFLENVLVGATAAKALWQYVEYMHNSTQFLNATATSQLPPEVDVVTTSPDIYPGCIVIAVVFLTFITLKRCAIVHILLIAMSGLVILAFLCVGFFHVDARNWNSPPGFFAHGIGGIFSGAALLMCTFSSIDKIASCAEESETPAKSLPTAFGFTIAIVFTCLFLVTSALTLASPWQQLADDASLARAFETHGIFAANFVIGAGALAGLLPVIIGSFLHPVRTVYALSEDGLLPKFFSKVGNNGIPSFSHFVVGIFILFCSLLLEFGALLEMSSIAIILEFTISAIITLLVRYQPNPVGISREYSDLDLSYTAYEDITDIQDFQTFKDDGRSRLVLFTEDDESSCGKSNIKRGGHEEDRLSLQLQFSDQRQHVSEFQKSPHSMEYQSLFVNRFKNRCQGSSETPIYSETDSLKNCAHGSDGRSQYKSYSTDFNPDFLYEGGRGCSRADVSEGNNNCNKLSLGGSKGLAAGARKQTRGDSYAGGFKVRKLSSSCSLRGSVAQVKVHTSDSTASSLVNLGAHDHFQADEASWRRARYFLLVYIIASVCLAVTTQFWPGHLSPAHPTKDGIGKNFAPISRTINFHPEPSQYLAGQQPASHSRSQYRKAFDSRIEESGQYDTVMKGDRDSAWSDHLVTDATVSQSAGPGGAWWAVVMLCVSLLAMLTSAFCIAKQPQNRTPLHFKTPYVPLVPLLALSGNMLLLAALPTIGWSRFALWTLAGLVVYCSYSRRHSRHRLEDDQEVVLFDISQRQAPTDSTN
ncbi:cationic amino acid transporter [Plakobranchus ocellatus]|uniref:Cationic amino acid transporter n=1 Tax=Plakobranchus ocellatus TaxID=259542 RepID=A0AAV3ZMS9_9GAST|nr:cationic amino acid transporter [Plakobranchus ocellatus]